MANKEGPSLGLFVNSKRREVPVKEGSKLVIFVLLSFQTKNVL